MKKHLLSLFLLITVCPVSYSQNESSYIELAKVIQTDGAIKEDWFTNEINSVSHVCPIFFNQEYGYGFIYSHFYDRYDPEKCPDGNCARTTYSTVRRN